MQERLQKLKKRKNSKIFHFNGWNFIMFRNKQIKIRMKLKSL